MSEAKPNKNGLIDAKAIASRKRHEKRAEKERQAAVWLDRETHFATLEKLATAMGSTYAQVARCIVERALENITDETIARYSQAAKTLESINPHGDARSCLMQYFSEIQHAVQVNSEPETLLRFERWQEELNRREKSRQPAQTGDITPEGQVAESRLDPRDITSTELPEPDLSKIAAMLGSF